jgi:hypothetical protein
MTIRAILLPALVVAGLGAPVGVRACDSASYTYETVVCYHQVTCYGTRQVPYTCPVTRYDECGRPYAATVTRYHDVKVPVTKLVPVKKVVRVYQ